MLTSELIKAIKSTGLTPTYQGTYSDSDILDLANEEQFTTIFPMMTSLRAEFFVVAETVIAAAGTSKIKIPRRAIGRTIREIHLSLNSNSRYNVPQLDIEDLANFTNNTTGTPFGFYVMGDSLYLQPATATACTAFLYYELRPSKLVLTSRGSAITLVTKAKINSINPTLVDDATITLNSVPNNLTVGSKIDITRNYPGYDLIYKDIVINNITNLTLTLTGFTIADNIEDVEVGDYVSTAEETVLVQMPDELHSVLAHAVAVRILEGQGLADQVKIVQEQLQRKIIAARNAFTPRVEGAQKKVINRNGILRGRTSFRRFPSITIV